MLSILLLIGLCIGYYYLHMKYPREDKELIYFGIFVVIYLVILYLVTYEREFIYRVLHFFYETHKKPLYMIPDNYSSNIISSMNHSTYQTIPFKTQVLQQQGSRCSECKNFILMKDEDKYHLDYKFSLYHGGSATMDNLCVICKTCKDFKRN